MTNPFRKKRLRGDAHLRRQKDYCSHGHEMTEENTLYRKSKRNGIEYTIRRCRTCRNDWNRKNRKPWTSTIKISSEMIIAGEEALRQFIPDNPNFTDIVSYVYRAMVRIQKGNRSPDVREKISKSMLSRKNHDPHHRLGTTR